MTASEGRLLAIALLTGSIATMTTLARALLAVSLLSGCATAGPIDQPPSDAPVEVMLDAADVQDAPTSGTPITKTLSETLTQDVIAVHTINCNNGAETAENHYYRVFPLPMFQIANALHVTSVSFGVEIVTGAAQVATVNVGTYAGAVTSSSTSLSTALMTTLASANVALPVTANPASAKVQIAADIPASMSLLVEVVTPSGLGANRAAVVGSNASTETLPSFTSSPDATCEETVPISFSALGHGEVHLVLTATGTYQP